jgi:hypothetical protein
MKVFYFECRILFIIFCLFNSFCLHAIGLKDSSYLPHVVALNQTAPDFSLTPNFSKTDKKNPSFKKSSSQKINIDSLVNDYKSQAKAEFDKLTQSNNYVESINPADLNELPLGLKKTINNTKVSIAVSKVTFYSQYAELTVFAKVDIQQEPKQLFFGLSGLKLSYNGGIIGDAKLALLGDITIPINGKNAALVLKGGMDMQTGDVADLTYVTIDCNGFKELGLSADIKFPKNMLVPVDANGTRQNDKNVTASFKTIVSDWNDILVDITLPRFEITPLEGISFNIQQAVFDFSDVRNSADIAYPNGYQSKYMDMGNPAIWRGVYIKQLEVVLPKQFSRRQDPNKRIGFAASNMIIDNNGISGSFSAENILSIEQGSASGWRFSVDKFNLCLEANQLIGAGFAGTIGLPVSDKDTLGYTAIINPGNEYLLKINPLHKLDFNVWKAKAELLPNSYVEFKLVDGKFKPEACLNGSLGIIATNKSETDTAKAIASFKGVRFQNLRLKTDAPYISADYFGYSGELKVAKFPVSIDSIGIRTTSTTATLYVGMKVNLMDGKFSGKTGLNIVGDFAGEDGMQKWKFQKVKLNTIEFAANFSEAFTLKGGIELLEDNPVYGNAFGGYIDATFVGKIQVKAACIFGSKDYRYWFVDAKAIFPGDGIPVLPPLAIHGFGGGAYYHMKKVGNDMLSASSFPSYIPDDKTSLGVRAAVMFNTKREICDGEASLEAAFNSSGGINYIGFYGYAKFVGKLPFVEDVNRLSESFNNINENYKKIADNAALAGVLEDYKQYDPTKAAEKILPLPTDAKQEGFSASVGMQYDFTQKTFHANFDLYVNAAKGMLVGAASQNRAGWAVMHISPQEWYMHMGTPTDRLGVKFGIGNFNIQTGAYLMVGSRIPASPPPPQEVANILGVELNQLDYMRDANALGDGRGLAFGANVTVNTGDITFLILYANFKAGLGFDLMLKNYGDAHCEGSNERIGFNGWYANGQAYAYLQGELGVKVNLLFIKTRIPIIQGAAAALLQAKLPNPSWFRGYLGVKFSVLGGLIKGNMRLKITIGNECHIVGADAANPTGIKIISDITPKDNSDKVDVFAVPQAAFNMRINQAFDVNNDKGLKTYRIKLEKFNVTNNGQPIPGRLQWNNNNDVLSFYSTEVLPPQKTIKAVAKISFEELANGNWITAYVDGKKVEEEKEITFKTSDAPKNIPLTNIEYAYPVVGQHNFYKDESPDGYIKLKRGQSYLFANNVKQQMLFAQENGKAIAVPATYDGNTSQVNFTLPALTTQSNYTCGLLNLPAQANYNVDSLLTYLQTQAGDDGSYEVKDNKANNVTRSDVVASLLNYTFHSSEHNSFAAKMNTIRLQQSIIGVISSDVISLQSRVNAYEVFDLPEIIGSIYTGNQPLVQATAVLDDAYFTQDIFPKNYKQYPLAGSIELTNRDTTELGLLPVKALPLMSIYAGELGDDNFNGYAKTRMPFIYNLPQIYKQDFLDLQNQVVNKFLGTSQQQQYEYLINGYFPFMRQGNYKVRYQYVLPNGKPASSAIFEYQNPIK